jgi:hypothetical protein
VRLITKIRKWIDMNRKKITLEEVDKVMKDLEKEYNFTFPEYDEYGNVILTSKEGVIIMSADSFHEAMKKFAKNNTWKIE